MQPGACWLRASPVSPGTSGSRVRAGWVVKRCCGRMAGRCGYGNGCSWRAEAEHARAALEKRIAAREEMIARLKDPELLESSELDIPGALEIAQQQAIEDWISPARPASGGAPSACRILCGEIWRLVVARFFVFTPLGGGPAATEPRTELLRSRTVSGCRRCRGRSGT